MITGWYGNRAMKHEYVSLAKIALTCGCSMEQLEQWLVEQNISVTDLGQRSVDRVDIISFLVENAMPVASVLLPSRCKKILLLTPDGEISSSLHTALRCFTTVFSAGYHVLIDTTVLDHFAELALLTFGPDLILLTTDMLFPGSRAENSQILSNLFYLAESQPETRIVLLYSARSEELTRLLVNVVNRKPLLLSQALSEEEMLTEIRVFLHGSQG